MKYFLIGLTICFLLLSITVLAQPGGGGPCPNPPCTPPIPIGGVELLLIAGAALGVRKLTRKE